MTLVFLSRMVRVGGSPIPHLATAGRGGAPGGPSGAKAPLDFWLVTARLKPCPFKTFSGFFAGRGKGNARSFAALGMTFVFLSRIFLVQDGPVAASPTSANCGQMWAPGGPSGAKAPLDFWLVTARLKPCPFKTFSGFFAGRERKCEVLRCAQDDICFLVQDFSCPRWSGCGESHICQLRADVGHPDVGHPESSERGEGRREKINEAVAACGGLVVRGGLL